MAEFEISDFPEIAALNDEDNFIFYVKRISDGQDYKINLRNFQGLITDTVSGQGGDFIQEIVDQLIPQIESSFEQDLQDQVFEIIASNGGRAQIGLTIEEIIGAIQENPYTSIIEDVNNALDTAITNTRFEREVNSVNSVLGVLNDEVLPELRGDLEELNETILVQLNESIEEVQEEIERVDSELENLNDTILPSITEDLESIDSLFPIEGTSISDGAITSNLIAANSINADKIIANSITANEIAANSIGADKIIANSIGADEIAANSIGADLIAANAIVADNIAVNAITGDRLAFATITSENLAAGSVTASTIAAAAIDGILITGALFRTSASTSVPRVVVGDPNFPLWYGTGNISTQNMVFGLLQDGTIYAQNMVIDDTSVFQGQLFGADGTFGTITSGNIQGTSISGGSITGTTITGTNISGNTISGGSITGATVTGGLLRTDSSGTRVEIEDGTYLIWAGSGTKNDSNALFYVRSNGTGFIRGEFFQGEILENKFGTASETSSVQTLTATASDHNSAGQTVELTANFNVFLEISGNTEGQPHSFRVQTFRGSTLLSTRNYSARGINFLSTTVYSLDGAVTFFDEDSVVGDNDYNVTLTPTNTPSGGIEEVDYTLSIKTFENKIG